MVRACICHTPVKNAYLYNDHRQRVDVGFLCQVLLHTPLTGPDAIELGGTVPLRIRGILRAGSTAGPLNVHHQRIQPKIGDAGASVRINEDT